MNTKPTFNWGIIGLGKIARKFALGMQVVPDANLYAVGSRNDEKAAAIAKEWGADRAYGNYKALVNDPEVQAVYIATPHPFHMEHTVMALEAGKAVLCEKPFAMNTAEVKQMVEIAQGNQVFLMEGMWTRFHPKTHKLLEWVNSGEIGEVKFLRADFGFRTAYNEDSRLFNKKLGGGSLLDIGVYPVFFAHLLFGKPIEIQAMGHLAPTGVDESCMVNLKYENGCMAQLFSNFVANSNIEAELFGTGGILKINRLLQRPGSLSIYRREIHDRDITFDEPANGMNHQIEEAQNCLAKGLLESPLMTHQFSLDVMATMDEILRQMGVQYG
ncbi:MAG: Gfo/Idh/MocA family oxidoreductase [Bacteroidota bacterium]